MKPTELLLPSTPSCHVGGYHSRSAGCHAIADPLLNTKAHVALTATDQAMVVFLDSAAAIRLGETLTAAGQPISQLEVTFDQLEREAEQE